MLTVVVASGDIPAAGVTLAELARSVISKLRSCVMQKGVGNANLPDILHCEGIATPPLTYLFDAATQPHRSFTPGVRCKPFKSKGAWQAPVGRTLMSAKSRARGAAVETTPPLAALAQLDLFPFKPVIEHLDPKRAVGPHTAVQHLIRVKLRPTEAAHMIFHDRHGWYCEAHGTECGAVMMAQHDRPKK